MAPFLRTLLSCVLGLGLAACPSDDGAEVGDTTSTDTHQADTAGSEDTAGPDTDAPDAAPDTSCQCQTDTDCAGALGDLAACQLAVCDPSSCACVQAPAVDGTLCDDGSPCTDGDVCDGGTCAGDAITCDDGVACTSDSCDPATGCQHAPDDGACAGDDDPCTEAVCDPVEGCRQDHDIVCDDGTACTVDVCVVGDSCPGGAEPVQGACYATLQTEGAITWEAARQACVDAGADLVSVADSAGNDLARANADAACGAGARAFIGLRYGAPEGGGEAVYTWVDGAATDYLPLADPDHGAGGAVLQADGTWAIGALTADCVLCEAPVAPFSCQRTFLGPDDPAASAEVCNGVDDDCDGVVDLSGETICDDGDACTIDVCAGALGCLHDEPTVCDDDVACTTDTCDPASGCVFTPVDDACDDGFACTVDTCDAVEGCGHAADDDACDDGQACTSEVCDVAAGCVYTSDDGACDDGFACTTDVCTPFDGCGHLPDAAICDDDNVCTTDSCAPGSGCVHEDVDLACDDGNPCTTDDACAAGTCQGGPPPICNDDVVCTADQCDPQVGCIAPIQGSDECDSPGPAGGYYEGPVNIEGVVPIGFCGDDVSFTCQGSVTAIIDASKDPAFQGSGHMSCLFDVVDDDDYVPGFVDGSVGETTVDAKVHFWSFSVDWDPAINYGEDGFPVSIGGTNSGTVPSDDLISAADPGAFWQFVYDLCSGETSTYTVTSDLQRVPVMGSCCGPPPLGCEPSEDRPCYLKGWEFIPDDVGDCCNDASCQLLSKPACDAVGGTFIPSTGGACCGTNLAGDQTCDAFNEALCAADGGAFEALLSCDDANADGFADACGPPADYGRVDPSVCALDGDTLRCDIGGVTSLPLRGNWTPSGAGFTHTGALGLVTPLGDVSFSETADVAVDTSGGDFSITGGAGAPSFLDVEAWPGLLLDLGSSGDLPLVFGYNLGYEILALGVEAPVADARSYLFLSADTSSDIVIGDAITFEKDEGNAIDLLVDYDDPAVIVRVGGSALESASGNLVKSAGLGLSWGGNLTWRSAVDIFDGETFTPRIATGHIWRAGEFALIPYPNLPANIFVEGDVIVDVGPAVDLIQPIAEALADGSWDALEDALVAAGSAQTASDVLADMSLAGNANALNLQAGPLSITVGAASWQVKDGALTFTGEAMTPGAAIAGDSNELLDALSALTLQATTKSWGKVDADGFRFVMETDVVAGPFALSDVRVIIDSESGVHIEGGSFDLDFNAFLQRLKTLMDCDFSGGGAACSVGGIPVASFSGSLDGGGFRLSGTIGVPVLGQVAMSATVSKSGEFTLTGTAQQGIPNFSSQSVSVSLSNSGFALSTTFEQFGATTHLSGSMSFDGDFSITGSRNIEVLGYLVQSASITISNSGLRITGAMRVLTGASMNIELVAPVNVTSWSLSGAGSLSVFGHQLGSCTVTASHASGGLHITGRVGIHSAQATLTGDVTPSSFSLSGSATLNIAGYTLGSATVTLSDAGLRVQGKLSVLGAQLNVAGDVQTNGNFQLTSTANVNVPVGGVSLNASGKLAKSGASVSVTGTASLTYAGKGFSSAFSFSSNGKLSWSASVSAGATVRTPRTCVGPVCTPAATILSVSGTVTAKISNNAFSARFSGTANGISVSGAVSSNGDLCISFPVVGYRCLDVL